MFLKANLKAEEYECFLFPVPSRLCNNFQQPNRDIHDIAASGEYDLKVSEVSSSPNSAPKGCEAHFIECKILQRLKRFSLSKKAEEEKYCGSTEKFRNMTCVINKDDLVRFAGFQLIALHGNPP
ncbi:hypothetical protein OXX69_001846 [Metschnikowia pulcherrima]